MIIDEQTYLQHYGVKGMKWGVRKERPSIGNRIGDTIRARNRKIASKGGRRAEAIKRTGNAINKVNDKRAELSGNLSYAKKASKTVFKLKKLDYQYKAKIRSAKDSKTKRALIDKWIRNRSDMDSELRKK